MTEGSRPFGGANERPDDGSLPGERPEKDTVGAAPDQSPRAAQGGMSGDVTRTPGNADGDPDAKAPGIADATGPQG